MVTTREKAFCAQYKLKRADEASECDPRLLFREPFVEGELYLWRKWKDHGRIYLRNGKPAVYVSHPYELSQEEFAELVTFCKDHELKWYISGDSWYESHAMKIVVTTQTFAW